MSLINRMVSLRNILKSSIVATLLFGSTVALAQAVPDPIQYVVAPETPGPREATLIEVQGVGSFLGDATITWSQDGKVIKRGVGERTYAFTTGDLGVPTTVRVSIDSSQGAFARSFTFTPAVIHLLWEADTTVPPLYRGKPLYSAGSNLRIVAFPTVYAGSARVTQTALSYQWSYKDEPLVDQSGLGRYSINLIGDQLSDRETVAVDVYYGAKKVAHGGLSIPASNPFVLLYQRDALRGPVYDTALPPGINLAGKELSIQAEPYYFATAAKRNGQLRYTWTLNDTETTGPDAPRGILTLRQAGAGQGDAILSASIQNTTSDQFVQTASTALRIVFGQESGSLLNFFGL